MQAAPSITEARPGPEFGGGGEAGRASSVGGGEKRAFICIMAGRPCPPKAIFLLRGFVCYYQFRERFHREAWQPA